MQNAIRVYDRVPVPQPSCSLFDIAQRLGVPVVVANCGIDGVATHATFGLDLDVNWAELAQAIDRVCENGAAIVANVEDHDQLGKWVAPLLERDIRFLVGLPLRDHHGQRIGSIAAMASQSFVAQRGISVSRLGQLGKDFAGV